MLEKMRAGRYGTPKGDSIRRIAHAMKIDEWVLFPLKKERSI